MERTKFNTTMTIDQRRVEEYDDLLRVLQLAGSLNYGNGIVGKIAELETLCAKLSKSDYDPPRQSFALWLCHLIHHEITQEQNTPEEAAPVGLPQLPP